MNTVFFKVSSHRKLNFWLILKVHTQRILRILFKRVLNIDLANLPNATVLIYLVS